MVKRGKFFSIFAVLTLLILLAPAVILAPGGNVAANAEDVVQEITATFTFNENVSGDWWNFTAGEGGIQAPGLCLEQYTRDNVVRNTTLADCGFRNYTTGSGSVASTVGNLNGTMTLEWITFRFNQIYSHTPKYNGTAANGTNFGWMAGRGHYYDEGNASNNFAFVFVADLDCNGNMTNAAGKGFMVSVEENGTFGKTNVSDPATHKIIGDFDITKTGASYSGTFHLRNYDPSEVYDLGMLNVTGVAMQEFTDPIHSGLDLLSFTSDDPQPTPTNMTTDFEEIAWGKEPVKNITGGPLGTNGTMDLSRNAALYIMLVPPLSVRIQETTASIQYINDTYAVTGNDGSPYGELWQLSLLYIPDQTLPFYEFFYQNGYTFTPFGMLNPSSECYAGTESFAVTVVFVEAILGDMQRYSTDQVFGLYPHPKVASVVPAVGAPGQTMNVTIKGKYFLRAAGQKSGWVPNSGSVDFGAGITVNSYTIKNSSPIDNAITANITIAGGASIGARDVNVTSCFGYLNGNGTAPYKSGHGAFSVVAAGSSLEGHVTFAGRGAAPNDKWIETFVVKGFVPGTSNLLWTTNATTNNTGVFTITGLTPGTYDIAIKNWTCLSELVAGVTLNSTAVVDFGTTREGDCNNDGWITGADRAILYTDWGKTVPPGTWHADFNRDGWLTGADRAFMYTYWGQH